MSSAHAARGTRHAARGGCRRLRLRCEDMTLLTKAQHPAVGGGPSASDSGDCGIEEVGWTDATMGRARASDLMHGIDPMP